MRHGSGPGGILHMTPELMQMREAASLNVWPVTDTSSEGTP
jgi:hypothetical protein